MSLQQAETAPLRLALGHARRNSRSCGDSVCITHLSYREDALTSPAPARRGGSANVVREDFFAAGDRTDPRAGA